VLATKKVTEVEIIFIGDYHGKKNEFQSNWILHPGVILAEFMNRSECSKDKFTEKSGWTSELLDNLLNGKISISKDMAETISTVIGMSKQFWLNLQANYETKLLKLNNSKNDEIRDCCVKRK
jgi:addiction module HigA family antidote